MTSSSSSGKGGGDRPDAASDITVPAKVAPKAVQPDNSNATLKPSAGGSNAGPAAAPTSAALHRTASSANAWDPTAGPIPQTTIPCPKCGAAVREVARFCQRCHMTMRFECPSCGNKQRTGVKCEKCGINFVKFIGAVVAAKQAEVDAVDAKLDRRSAFLKNLVALPLTGGISLVKHLLRTTKRKS
jgi:hypothetical protein